MSTITTWSTTIVVAIYCGWALARWTMTRLAVFAVLAAVSGAITLVGLIRLMHTPVNEDGT